MRYTPNLGIILPSIAVIPFSLTTPTQRFPHPQRHRRPATSSTSFPPVSFLFSISDPLTSRVLRESEAKDLDPPLPDGAAPSSPSTPAINLSRLHRRNCRPNRMNQIVDVPSASLLHQHCPFNFVVSPPRKSRLFMAEILRPQSPPFPRE
ncbi:hypothetical protein PIB30_044789 [Stylosanthes scabra]|uniref:Uncharacterized protein n=1 Tax=Stylosanthes scabra TaxID=79078 RepID=A0ABU6TGL8_9FABA|nr:hypothetical protein [Stylosanthes scabra]